jgi:hypothetical protein
MTTMLSTTVNDDYWRSFIPTIRLSYLGMLTASIRIVWGAMLIDSLPERACIGQSLARVEVVVVVGLMRLWMDGRTIQYG